MQFCSGFWWCSKPDHEVWCALCHIGGVSGESALWAAGVIRTCIWFLCIAATPAYCWLLCRHLYSQLCFSYTVLCPSVVWACCSQCTYAYVCVSALRGCSCYSECRGPSLVNIGQACRHVLCDCLRQAICGQLGLSGPSSAASTAPSCLFSSA
jgi:hypothetical protein